MVLDVALPIWSKRLRKPILFLHIQQWSPFRSAGTLTSLGWENLRETAMFHGKIMCNPLFSVKIFPPQPIHWSTGNSFHRKIWVFFSRWLGRFLASLGRRTGSMFWGELINLSENKSENIWKQKTVFSCSRRSSRRWQSGCEQWLGL